MFITLEWIKYIKEYEDPILDFCNKNLNDEDIELLIPCVVDNKNIKCLILCHNQITSKGAILLTKNLSNIEHLVLAYNWLDNTCLYDLATSKLKSLDISWNNINDEGVNILIKHCYKNKLTNITVTSIFVSSKMEELLSQKLKEKIYL